MGFIGVQPASVPLTASDITNDIINADKIADNSISEEHLDPTVITGLSALGAEPADTDEFLISDAGTLKRMDYSYIKGGGDLVKLGTVATNNSNVSALTIDNCFSSTYDMYRIIGYHNATTNGAHQYFRWRTGGASGSSYTTADYMWINHGYYLLTNNNAGSYINKNGAQDTGRVASDMDSDGSASYVEFDLLVSDPTTSTMSRAMVTGTSVVRQSTDNRFTAHHVGITNDSNVNATGFQMTLSTGNISYGRVTVYGYTQA